ncbi:MAG: hypothetical protein U0360_08390 [Dehalococcoidia bacterium]
MRTLEVHELAIETVVLGVADLGLRERVVAVVVITNGGAQLLDAEPCRLEGRATLSRSRREPRRNARGGRRGPVEWSAPAAAVVTSLAYRAAVPPKRAPCNLASVWRSDARPRDCRLRRREPRAVARAWRAGFEAVVSAEPAVAASARVMITAGRRRRPPTMRHLREGGLVEPVLAHIEAGRPFLGMWASRPCSSCPRAAGAPVHGHPRWADCALPAGDDGAAHGLEHGAPDGAAPGLRGASPTAPTSVVHSYHPLPADPAVVWARRSTRTCASPRSSGRATSSPRSSTPEKSGPAGLRLYSNFLHLAKERGSIAPETEAATALGTAG